VDIRDEVLNISRQLGVDIAINANQGNPVDVIREKTHGIGPDVVFDCASGSPEVGLSGTKTLFQSLDTVRNGGKLVPVSLLEPNAVIGYTPLINRRLQYRHSRPCTSKERSWMLHLIASKKVQIEPLVTHVLEGLDKLPQAIEITSNKSKYGAINPAQVRVAY